MSISFVNSWGAFGSQTCSITPSAVGDILVLLADNGSGVGSSGEITAVSGGPVASWNQAASGEISGNSSVWWGIVNTTATSTVTVTNSAASYADLLLVFAEYSGGSVGAWAQDGAGGSTSGSLVTSGTFPSLTPSVAGDLYVGILISNPAASGSTAGFTYTQTISAIVSLWVYNLGCGAGAQAPAWSVSSSSNYGTSSALFTFTPYQTVTFDANGGSGSMAPQSYGSPEPLDFNAFSNPGYAFAGWNTLAGGGGTAYADGAIYSFAASVTLYAQWVPAYTVTFDPNGGTGAMSPESGAVPFTLELNAFTRNGFTFTGWNTVAAGGGTAYANGATYSTTADVTLYAQWSANSYTITFNANGGTGTMSNESGTLPITLTLNAFTRTGYGFTGWNTVAGGGGTAYADGASYNVASNATLYAQWSTPTAPSAPTLTAPANASYVDVVGGVTLGPAGYNSTDGNPQNAYALRVKVSGGSYQYWNASTAALQSTIVWNSDSVPVGGSWSVALPAGVLADGNIYNWSMASQELTGLQGAFATDFTFTAQAAPSVTVTAPTGTVTVTTQPAIDWTPTLPSGATQTNYRVVVESGSYGTGPGSGTQWWDTGVVASSATTTNTGVALSSPGTYRVFVQITESGAEVSPWAYSTFTLSADAPATPLLTGVAGNDSTTGAPIVFLSLQALDNLLTENEASFETGAITGWVPAANTALAASTAWAQDGSYSMSLTATAAGSVGASLPAGTSGYPVLPAMTVRAMASFHSPATSRQCSLSLSFYNSAGTLLSTVASASAASTLTGAGGFAFVSGSAPLDATFVSVSISAASLGASELLYVDNVLLAPGTSTTWTAGGFVGTTVANFSFSDDGVNWYALRNGTGVSIPTANQVVTAVDYEGSLGFERHYQAQVVVP